MAIEFENAILAGVTLVREAIQSQNFVQGADGWQIKADGSAEFSDLTIRSSDGSSSTVTVANGRITITNGAGVTLIEIDAAGYRLYDADGDLVARISLSDGGDVGGFWTRGFQFPRNIASQLSGGVLDFAPVDSGIVEVGGYLEYVVADEAATPYARMMLSTGQIAGTDDPVHFELESERGSVPVARLYGTTLTDPADLEVVGTLTAGSRITGVTSITPVAGTPTSKDIVFPQELTGSNFVCHVTANTSVPGTTVQGVGYTALSSTGVTLWLTRSNTTTTNICFTVEGS